MQKIVKDIEGNELADEDKTLLESVVKQFRQLINNENNKVVGKK